MAKYALCIPAANISASMAAVRAQKGSARFTDPSEVQAVLNQEVFSMEDRATCETDPSLLQLIPYVVCKDQEGKVFMYTRGVASGETRLVAKRSIGLGGHVDSVPPEGISLMRHLQNEAVRELHEEIGVEVDPAEIQIEAMLVDATVPVQEVHLGVMCMYTLKGDETLNHEEGVIDNGEFKDTKDIYWNYEELEQWSKLAIEHVVNVDTAVGEENDN